MSRFIMELIINKGDGSQQKVLCYVYFWKLRFLPSIYILHLRELPNDTKLLRNEVLLLKIWEQDWPYFLLFSLFFTIYFARYLKTSLADICTFCCDVSQMSLDWMTEATYTNVLLAMVANFRLIHTQFALAMSIFITHLQSGLSLTL